MAVADVTLGLSLTPFLVASIVYLLCCSLPIALVFHDCKFMYESPLTFSGRGMKHTYIHNIHTHTFVYINLHLNLHFKWMVSLKKLMRNSHLHFNLDPGFLELQLTHFLSLFKSPLPSFIDYDSWRLCFAHILDNRS